MECLIHSPAFNTVKMAWVAGLGATERGGLRAERGAVQCEVRRHDLEKNGERASSMCKTLFETT